jgi:hypothetical protein
MPCPYETFQLSGPVTIDASGGHFLTKARARCRELNLGAVASHTTRDAAVANCLAATGDVTIVGHGERGAIGAGCGRIRPDSLEVIDRARPGNWSANHRMRTLTLLGCHVGAGEEGAALLFEIARRTGVVVRAPVGFVHIGLDCEDFYLYPGGAGWQVAAPERKPDPIA